MKKVLAFFHNPRYFCAVNQHQHNMKTTITINLGNNEAITRGVFSEKDGTFTAMTFTRSKNFKTKTKALRWFAKAIGQA